MALGPIVDVEDRRTSRLLRAAERKEIKNKDEVLSIATYAALAALSSRIEPAYSLRSRTLACCQEPYTIRSSRQCLTHVYKPKFHLARHVTTGHDVRVERVVTSLSSRTCSNMADDEEAVVLACTGLVCCSLDLHQSQEQLLKK